MHPIIGVKQDEFEFTLVNIKSHWKTSEPFVLASQAVQVFYVPESKEKNWHVVIATKPRDLYDLEADVIPEVEVLQVDNSTSVDAEEFIDVREDIVGVILNEPFVDAIERSKDVEIDSNNSSALLKVMKMMRHYMILILNNLYMHLNISMKHLFIG